LPNRTEPNRPKSAEPRTEPNRTEISVASYAKQLRYLIPLEVFTLSDLEKSTPVKDAPFARYIWNYPLKRLYSFLKLLRVHPAFSNIRYAERFTVVEML
jgi:hypothetical protein